MSIQTYLTGNRFPRFLYPHYRLYFFRLDPIRILFRVLPLASNRQNFSVYAEEMKLPWWIATFYA